jgi:hypothetical protein
MYVFRPPSPGHHEAVMRLWGGHRVRSPRRPEPSALPSHDEALLAVEDPVVPVLLRIRGGPKKSSRPWFRESFAAKVSPSERTTTACMSSSFRGVMASTRCPPPATGRQRYWPRRPFGHDGVVPQVRPLRQLFGADAQSSSASLCRYSWGTGSFPRHFRISAGHPIGGGRARP